MQRKKLTLSVFSLAVALMTGPAFAVVSFTETFDTNASGWLNGASAAPTYNSTGGIDDSGYISYIHPLFTSPSSGSFGAPPLELMFRGNDAANASGDAFVGNWISSGVITLSLAVRHNYTTDLNFYARLAGSLGAGASLAVDEDFLVAPDTWTLITIAITDSNPPFSSYGASTFSGTFSNVLNLQFGLYLPASTEFTGLRMDIDNVGVVAVPEPSTWALIGCAAAALMIFKRRLIA